MLRSLLFNAAFYLVTMLFTVLGSFLLLAPRAWPMACFRFYSWVIVRLMKLICGTGLEVRGHDRLPAAPALVAAKHQSAWDTVALPMLLQDPSIVMKRELAWIPLYGWFAAKFGMIFVRREAGPAALRRMGRDAAARAAQDREVLIFPEGTRRAPGAPPDYRPGVLHLYETLGVPCCPVALNSGLFWPRRSLRRYPGTIVVEFLEPIPPGLPRKEFSERLQRAIETATDRLIREAAEAPNPPPIPAETRQRLGL